MTTKNGTSQEPEPSCELRDDSSMSRGRTRRSAHEYATNPRDPAGYATSSAESYVYEDGHGGYAPRGAAGPSSGPGHYQAQMLNEHGVTMSDARARAAEADKALREYHQLPHNRVLMQNMEASEPGRESRRHGEHHGSGGHRSSKKQRAAEDAGCCIIL